MSLAEQLSITLKFFEDGDEAIDDVIQHYRTAGHIVNKLVVTEHKLLYMFSDRSLLVINSNYKKTPRKLNQSELQYMVIGPGKSGAFTSDMLDKYIGPSSHVKLTKDEVDVALNAIKLRFELEGKDLLSTLDPEHLKKLLTKVGSDLGIDKDTMKHDIELILEKINAGK
jgi:hypothetical protein